MRYVVLAGLLGLALAFDLGLLVVTWDDSFESFDPHHPGTLLPIVAGRLRALEAEVRERVCDLLDVCESGGGEPSRQGRPAPVPRP